MRRTNSFKVTLELGLELDVASGKEVGACGTCEISSSSSYSSVCIPQYFIIIHTSWKSNLKLIVVYQAVYSK
jgi:hypothetical protein